MSTSTQAAPRWVEADWLTALMTVAFSGRARICQGNCVPEAIRAGWRAPRLLVAVAQGRAPWLMRNRRQGYALRKRRSGRCRQ